MSAAINDGLNRLTSETTPQGVAGYTYDAAPRRQTMTVTATGQTALTTNYTFDTADRVTGLTQGAASVAIGYDADSRRATVTLPNSLIESAGYDAASQLTGLSYLQGQTTLGSLSYGYDLAGRRTNVGGSYARVTLPTAVTSATYDKADQLSSWGGAAYTYDLNGNVVGDDTNSYTWNGRNQLTALTGGSTASFAYDALGRRQSKTLGGTTTSFLYDVVNPVQELNGTTIAASLFTGLGTDEYFSRTDSAGARSLFTDALGSTLALADSSGTVQTQYTYDPFGNTTATGSSSGNPYQFTGRENDGDGLYELRARYYNPTTGRFIGADPLGFGGGSTNLYGYAGDDPTDMSDPSGAGSECFLAGGTLGTGLEGLGSPSGLSEGRCGPSGIGMVVVAGAGAAVAVGIEAAQQQPGQEDRPKEVAVPVSQSSSAPPISGRYTQGTCGPITTSGQNLLEPQNWNLLAGLSVLQAKATMAPDQGWWEGPERPGARAGWACHEGTNRSPRSWGSGLIRCHQGGGHHGAGDYWKVSSSTWGISPEIRPASCGYTP